ncbi:hypothetical protein SCMU_13180 [Sinomonas cyclohexanicum]|uniref:Uncharacterized protein n=1 Tax=Sinomonas cyclohexanicum TaxID=322009 RepID=A0ABM7PTA2_SINCY|nr:hypothetical protein [Corynebacterium cyclohexanicum]BCT75476.1 hypothetical protein SCMU_13180 [Corynebacterium cyclohexanicum]
MRAHRSRAWMALLIVVVALVLPVGASAPDWAGESKVLALPRIPWEGGPDYWKQFPAADAAGWSSPDFFPIVAWYNGISSDSEAQYDKGLGINTYIGMDASTPYSLFVDNGMYWIGPALNDTFTSASKNWVGTFLDDEVDGRYTPEQGRAHLRELSQAARADGRFAYTNFTQSVLSRDMPAADAEAYVNDFTDVVSVDMYWYTVPFCSAVPYRENYLIAIPQNGCRSSAAYGTAVTMLRERDAADGRLQPLWQFVEDLNGGPGDQPFTVDITPAQLEGAVMSSLIGEARGIVYFNQSLSGPCQGGSILRLSQVEQDFCGAGQTAAVGRIDALIRQLAPVLNTQSFAYSFGPDLRTMFKVSGDSAYIFSMIGAGTSPGQRSFHLPAGVTGRTVEVIDENRTIPVGADGAFSDSFGGESAFHVYRVHL